MDTSSRHLVTWLASNLRHLAITDYRHATPHNPRGNVRSLHRLVCTMVKLITTSRSDGPLVPMLLSTIHFLRHTWSTQLPTNSSKHRFSTRLSSRSLLSSPSLRVLRLAHVYPLRNTPFHPQWHLAHFLPLEACLCLFPQRRRYL